MVKTSRALVQSNDLVAYEDLKVRNMVKNHHLAKSISDASWSQFTTWMEYFGKVFGVGIVAVPPHYTSQDCSHCGATVKKTLSTRTHTCQCGTVLDRDHNAALNILKLGLSTVGHQPPGPPSEEEGTRGCFAFIQGINASGEDDLCVVGETSPRKSTRRKRKSKE